ncbi:MAG: DUF308 domain-containing protein [Anaerolineae bacterium]|jgi:uncharacterized membrane protein HdeD (DUF308 family)
MAFWITLIRGMLAITLGVALIFQPDKARPMLVNFMGMFWLVSGIVSLRWGVHGERAKGLSLLAGAIGVLAGVGMLSRRFTTGMVGEDVLISVVGLIILLTGLMHIFGGFRTGPVETHLFSQDRKWSWTAFLLGLFEMILGLMLVIEPMGRGPLVYFAASIWALLGGAILIGDAVRQRRARQRQAQPDHQGRETEQRDEVDAQS